MGLNADLVRTDGEANIGEAMPLALREFSMARRPEEAGVTAEEKQDGPQKALTANQSRILKESEDSDRLKALPEDCQPFKPICLLSPPPLYGDEPARRPKPTLFIFKRISYKIDTVKSLLSLI